MAKSIEQLTDKYGHLIEFICPCADGQVLVRWFTHENHIHAHQLLPPDSADWVKAGLLKNGYYYT